MVTLHMFSFRIHSLQTLLLGLTKNIFATRPQIYHKMKNKTGIQPVLFFMCYFTLRTKSYKNIVTSFLIFVEMEGVGHKSTRRSFSRSFRDPVFSSPTESKQFTSSSPQNRKHPFGYFHSYMCYFALRAKSYKNIVASFLIFVEMGGHATN